MHEPPAPANGRRYGMGEFLDHAFGFKMGKEHGAFIKSVISKYIPNTAVKNPYHYVPVCKAIVYNITKKRVSGKYSNTTKSGMVSDVNHWQKMRSWKSSSNQ